MGQVFGYNGSLDEPPFNTVALAGAAAAAPLRSQGFHIRVLRASARHYEGWGIACMKVRLPQSQRSSRDLVLTVGSCQFVLKTACTD